VAILGAIRDEFAVEPGGDGGLEVLFDHPTVAELATAVRKPR
jgi:hypothetical protein